MAQNAKKPVPPAMETRLALLKDPLLPYAFACEDSAVGAQLVKVSRDLHKTGKTIVTAWKLTPDADIGRAIAALDKLEEVRTAVTTSLLMPSALASTKPMKVVANESSSASAR